MATKEPKRLKIEAETNIAELLDALKADKEPLMLEKDGEDIAVPLSAKDYVIWSNQPKSKRNKDKFLSMLGVWKDLDTGRMVEEIYRARHESPPSKPVDS